MEKFRNQSCYFIEYVIRTKKNNIQHRELQFAINELELASLPWKR